VRFVRVVDGVVVWTFVVVSSEDAFFVYGITVFEGVEFVEDKVFVFCTAKYLPHSLASFRVNFVTIFGEFGVCPCRVGGGHVVYLMV